MLDKVLVGEVGNDIVKEMDSPVLTSSSGWPNLMRISSNKKLADVSTSFFLVAFASTHSVA